MLPEVKEKERSRKKKERRKGWENTKSLPNDCSRWAKCTHTHTHTNAHRGKEESKHRDAVVYIPTRSPLFFSAWGLVVGGWMMHGKEESLYTSNVERRKTKKKKRCKQ
jgi:hypothetical protein